jgi:hypothetical protein
MTVDARKAVQVRPLGSPEGETGVQALSPGARIEMMWQLALNAWAFKGEPQGAESRLQRHVVRVRRGGG